MKHTLKNPDESTAEIIITVEPKEYEPFLVQAASRISQSVNIKGFRKGKAPYDRVKQEVGTMKLLQEALESIVQKTLVDAIKIEKLETVGPPQINIEKIAPENELVFKATLSLLPKITLPDLKTLKAKKKKTEVTDKKVEETIDTIRKMQATEVIKSGTTTKDDKVVIDMDMFINKVPVEGGSSKDHQVYLSEDHYIPGFSEKLMGVKKGDTKEFELDFPKEHYQKNLAGKKVEFKVKVNEVFSRQIPKADDGLAKKIGQKNLAELKKMIRNNMEKDFELKAEQAFEIELLEDLIKKSQCSKIPQIIIDSEKQKMYYELKRDLDRNGVGIDKYLADIKKTEKDLFDDFNEQATKRAQAALISRQIALENKLEVSKEEIDSEVKKISDAYKHNLEAQENLKRSEVRDSIATTLQNKKVMDYIKKQTSFDSKKAPNKEDKS